MTGRDSQRRIGRPSAVVLVLALAVSAAAMALGVVAARGPAPGRSMQDRVREVALTLRCPVCQDLSVADSPSPLASQMRGIIEENLSRGMSAGQIRQRFVDQYGQWILLAPPTRGIDLVAWIIPAVLLLAGVALAWGAVSKWTRAGEARSRVDAAGQSPLTEDEGPGLPPADRTLLERALRASGEGQ